MKIILTIKGTHCASCKMLIEDVCMDHKEVSSCVVDFTTGKMEIDHNGFLDINALIKEIEGLGEYKVEPELTSGNIIAKVRSLWAQDRRQFILRLCAAGIGLAFFGWFLMQSVPSSIKPALKHPASTADASTTDYALYEKNEAEVLPGGGFRTKIILGNIVPSMVADGVIDMSKMQALYKNNGGIPADEMKILTQLSNTPLVVNAPNASWLVNILWPIGLSNKMAINKSSPIAGKDLNNFASTGGWSLGTQESGGAYFNVYPLVPLTPEQEARVRQIAENTYRPCCDNSTFFQDCNHGSAALALIELGVAQGLPDAEIFATLLYFNSFWFPQNYVQLGLYFKALKGIDWKDVDPKVALSKDYSSATGNYKVQAEVAKIPNLVPPRPASGGAKCGA